MKWHDDDIALLRELYPHNPTRELCGLLDRTEQQVYFMARKLGIKKSPEYLAGPHACRLRRGDNVGAGNRFKPGNDPWNKGMKG